MIIDTFLYSGYDHAAVEVRMEVLKDVVDLHVAVQGNLTFQGQPRERSLVPEGCKSVTVSLSPAADPWGREAELRDACAHIGFSMSDAKPDNLILVSDADEIPHPDAIRQAQGYDGIMFLQTDARQWFMNWRYPNDWQLRQQPVAGRWADFESAGGANAARFNYQGWPSAGPRGWHFSGLGDERLAQAKLGSFSHTEYAHRALDPLFLRSMRDARRDYLDRFALERTTDLPPGEWGAFLG